MEIQPNNVAPDSLDEETLKSIEASLVAWMDGIPCTYDITCVNFLKKSREIYERMMIDQGNYNFIDVSDPRRKCVVNICLDVFSRFKQKKSDYEAVKLELEEKIKELLSKWIEVLPIDISLQLNDFKTHTRRIFSILKFPGSKYEHIKLEKESTDECVFHAHSLYNLKKSNNTMVVQDEAELSLNSEEAEPSLNSEDESPGKKWTDVYEDEKLGKQFPIVVLERIDPSKYIKIKAEPMDSNEENINTELLTAIKCEEVPIEFTNSDTDDTPEPPNTISNYQEVGPHIHHIDIFIKPKISEILYVNAKRRLLETPDFFEAISPFLSNLKQYAGCKFIGLDLKQV